MVTRVLDRWEKKVVAPEKVLERIEPGMTIFLGTAAAEPRTLVRHLMESDAPNLQDLELIQIVSLGDVVSIDSCSQHKYRLKTFFSGWVASEAITQGSVDLIPCRFSRIPALFEEEFISADAAFLQVTPPDEAGYMSLGVSVDAARQVMSRASLVVGEVDPRVPYTMGDTFVHVDEFGYLVEATETPIYFPRWPMDPVFDRIGRHVASLVPDGSCVAFFIGPLFESLARHLSSKRDMGVHTIVFTDALMELVKSGAVTNRFKGNFRGKCLTSYALGSEELMRWLDRNPLVEFQGIDVVGDPNIIGQNDRVMVVLPARKVDLAGRVAMHFGKGNVAAGPGEALEFFMGAALSRGSRTMFALPSRNLKGQSNVLLSVADLPNQFPYGESLDFIVTEYGVASLKGRTIRERAMALIDIAHPDHRQELVSVAKEARILYRDQIYLAESGHLYPEDIACEHTFKGGLRVRFRPIRPSDEDLMRRLFYRFSDEAVYYRYFSPIKTMPHMKMQEYVNVDYRDVMSIVGLVGDPPKEKIIAEARYVKAKDSPYADIAFVVDEEYQGKGIGTFLFLLLIKIAKQRGIEGLTGDVLATNRAMLAVLQKSPYPVQAVLDSGVYRITIPFADFS